jgi:catechol 2,3-dioxygenase-like lactoylglutathione lyase family enzyme
MLQKLHHVAYRCRDARETVKFYSEVIGLRFTHAITNDRVPSTQAWSPHCHIFFEMADGSFIAFFELPESPPSAPTDPNTPDWVQHLALEVKDQAALLEGKRRLEANGVSVVGPHDHGMCNSIYFFDPSGHRMEMAVVTEKPGEREEMAREAYEILDEWEARKAARVTAAAQ